MQILKLCYAGDMKRIVMLGIGSLSHTVYIIIKHGKGLLACDHKKAIL